MGLSSLLFESLQFFVVDYVAFGPNSQNFILFESLSKTEE